MSELIKHSRNPLPLSVPHVSVNVRPGTPGDLGFIDGLQKLHTHRVGWMPTKQLEEKIAAGRVLVAESTESKVLSTECEETRGPSVPELTQYSALSTQHFPFGYVIGQDQYFKRDDVGIVYQLNVLPSKQRGFIGATLLKALFERSAYGCRLFCCWCAQDIDANHFWESMGFVPLAFRAGSAKKGRVHIFWQKRIRAGDTQTPWWYPSQTNSGSIREDRLVLPIPPGTHWSDAKPIMLPRESAEGNVLSAESAGRRNALPDQRKVSAPKPPVKKPNPLALSRLRFASASDPVPGEKPKAPRATKPKLKNDPAHVAAARELRDRWLEQVNGAGTTLPTNARYDVTRTLDDRTSTTAAELPMDPPCLLPAA